ncbi:MAG: DUF4870 domain-containing protein [Chloroflexi bacterium]|nr:DUF4870 domain-containing protein [Chloroflexota bacterium]
MIQPRPFSFDERRWAALAHSNSMFLFLLVGGPSPIAAVGLLLTGAEYLLKRSMSRWVAFQTLQALIYQVLAYLLISALMIAVVPAPPAPQTEGEIAEITTAAGIVFGLSMVGLFYGVIGLVRCIRGRHFRYLLLGHLLERSMRPLEE